MSINTNLMSIETLEELVKTNAQSYYTTGAQNLSDEEFDSIIARIRAEKPDSPVLTTGWGFEPVGEKVKHKYTHIGSLQKIHTVLELIKKIKTRRIKIAAKLDGISLVLYYVDGVLVDAVTRGNGDVGISVLHKVKNIPGVMYELPDTSFTGAVRGEVFMTPHMFKLYKEKYPEAKNARNSSAGIVNADTSDDYEYLSLYAYTVIANENNSNAPANINTLYSWLNDNFLYVVPNFNYVWSMMAPMEVEAPMLEQKLLELKAEWEQLVTLDGLVMTAETVDHDAQTGVYTYNQIAYKFQDELKMTRVKCIEWTMSKNQAYIPVVVFEPVELEGTTVQRASGYNALWIQKVGIHEGMVVFVKKANQIIPTIVSFLDDNGKQVKIADVMGKQWGIDAVRI